MNDEAKKIKDLESLQKHQEHKKSFSFACGFLFVFCIVLFFVYTFNHNVNHKQLADAQYAELDAAEFSIQNNMRFATSPLLIFDKSRFVKQFLDKDDALTREVFSDIFLSFISEVSIYQQMRLIDNDGLEIIRVDNLSGGVYKIVKKEELQDKSSRYYFIDTLDTPLDTIYISPFDLNIEHGEIEIPFNPMIRIGKAYESNSGETNGMMILNISGQNLLDDISNQNIHKNDEMFLLNKDGYYLLSDDYDKNFAFMFPEKKEIGFFNDYEVVWEKIQNGEELIELDSGNFFTRKITLLDQKYYKTNENIFYLVMYVPASEIHRVDKNLIYSLVGASLILMPLIITLGWYFGKSRTENIFYKKKLEITASHDSMTGLYNRRMIMELLAQMIGLSKRKNEKLSIAFIDINNLKYVNDNFGHKMGDKMILGAADSLTDSIRTTDLVARLGGDEFLIVLPNCSEEDAHEIMYRASELLSYRGLEEMNSPWVMSYGCAELKESEILPQFILRADKLMYENKRMHKSKK